MMKQSFRYLIILAVVMFVGGCSQNILDTEPTSQLSEATFWKTAEDALMALNGCYRPLTSYYMYEGGPYLDVCAPNAYNHYPWEGYRTIGTGQHDATQPGAILGKWRECYRIIGRVNTLLAKLPDIPMDESLRTRIEGEALFLRALSYFTLSDFYGGVPIVTEPPAIEHGQLPRNTKEEVITLVLSDLDQAAAKLPENQGDAGRATKGAAIALKARVLLYQARWSEAAQAAKQVMDMGIYSLFPDYRGLFLPQNENNSEVIFDVQYKAPEIVHGWDTYIAPMGVAGGWASIVPLPNLVEDYYMKDGLPTSQSPLYDPNNPYENRDPRFYQTIFYPGSKILGQDFDPSSSYTGFAFKKYTEYDETGTEVPSFQSNINFIVLRYADVLLMYAEARNEASGPDQSVYDAVNQVRRRAGMPDLPAGLTQEQMRQEIRHERRIEFVLEGLYYSDIRRWKIAEIVIPQVKFETRQFNPARDYLWPIPFAEIEVNPNLEQNPGY